MFISEVFINQTKGCRFSETEPYEPFTTDIKRLFQSLQKEYGRCIGKIYIDRDNAEPQAIGWVFEKRMRYEDARDNSPDSFYVREVWVTVHTDIPTRTVTYRYANLEQ